MKKSYRRKAWLLDEDVLLEGYVSKKVFKPNSFSCGFISQKIRKKDIGRILFYDIDAAKNKTRCKKVIL